jgi:hypothetical protein
MHVGGRRRRGKAHRATARSFGGLAILRDWRRLVAEYNAVVRPRNVGRPLAASDAQRDTVFNLRRRGLPLRPISEETNLNLSTVRTIVEQRDQRDRTSIKHLQRIRRDMGEDARGNRASACVTDCHAASTPCSNKAPRSSRKPKG